AVALRPAIDRDEGDRKGPHPTHHHPRPYGDKVPSPQKPYTWKGLEILIDADVRATPMGGLLSTVQDNIRTGQYDFTSVLCYLWSCQPAGDRDVPGLWASPASRGTSTRFTTYWSSITGSFPP